MPRILNNKGSGFLRNGNQHVASTIHVADTRGDVAWYYHVILNSC